MPLAEVRSADEAQGRAQRDSLVGTFGKPKPSAPDGASSQPPITDRRWNHGDANGAAAVGRKGERAK